MKFDKRVEITKPGVYDPENPRAPRAGTTVYSKRAAYFDDPGLMSPRGSFEFGEGEGLLIFPRGTDMTFWRTGWKVKVWKKPFYSQKGTLTNPGLRTTFAFGVKLDDSVEYDNTWLQFQNGDILATQSGQIIRV